jgi:hypothetical protein
MVCQNFVNAGLANIRDHLAELPNRHPSIFQHCSFHFRNRFVWNRWLYRTLFVMDVCTSIFEFSAPFAHVLYAQTPFSVDFTQLGMNVHRRSVFCTQKTNHSVIRTWREKRMGAPSLTAAKPRLSVADSSPEWELGEGEPSYTPVWPYPP